jgi:hypothetical protein
MALIETSMYGNYQAPDYLGNFQRGMQVGQQFRQNQQDREKKKKDEDEAKKFETTFRGLTQVNDISTPEGRTGLLRDLNTLGYGKQALGLMSQFQEMAPKPTEYDFREGEGGLFATPKNNPTRAIQVQGFTPKPQQPKEWDPLGQAKFDEQKRHNKAIEARAAFDAAKAAQSGTKLNEAQSKIVGAAGMAKVMLDDLANQFKDSKLGGVKGFAADVVESIPLVGGKMAPKTNEYNDKRRITAETFLREATGAAAPAEEIKFYTRLLPEAGDSPEQAQSALNAFRGAVMAKVKGVASTLRAQGKDDQAAQIESKMQALFDSSANIKGNSPSAAVKTHPQDSEAVQWAKANPNDPRSVAILKANGL